MHQNKYVSDDKPLRVLGVSASPRSGATSVLVRSALLGAKDVDNIVTEFVSLAGKTVHPCTRCSECLEAGGCVIDDDMTPLYDRLREADALILGTPVYFGSPSGLCKAFMERVAGFGLTEKILRLKIGGAIAAGGSRNGGQETSLLAIHLWFHMNDMIPIGITAPVTQWGPTSSGGMDPLDITRDRFELKMSGESAMAAEIAWMYGKKIATVARIVSTGIRETGLDLPHTPYGYELPEFPASLYEISP